MNLTEEQKLKISFAAGKLAGGMEAYEKGLFVGGEKGFKRGRLIGVIVGLVVGASSTLVAVFIGSGII